MNSLDKIVTKIMLDKVANIFVFVFVAVAFAMTFYKAIPGYNLLVYVAFGLLCSIVIAIFKGAFDFF